MSPLITLTIVICFSGILFYSMYVIARTLLIYYFISFCYIIKHSLCVSKNYCSAQFCNNSKHHVMCKFKSPGSSRNCINYEKLINTEEEKQNVLHRINERRNKIASGEIRSLPSAENMQKLEWNDELEIFAQRWADQCFQNNTVSTDLCRDLENISVGQNIGTLYGESPGVTPSSLVDLWYIELLNINTTILSRYIPSSVSIMQQYDYFTQLAWAKSSYVGCGGVKYMEKYVASNENKNRTVYRLICNFAPSGNVIGETVYNDGVPCSGCPYGGQCDSKYNFLCISKTGIPTYGYNDDFLTRGHANFFGPINLKKFSEDADKPQTYEATTSNRSGIGQLSIMKDITNDNDTGFDFLSHLFDITSTHLLDLKQTTHPCKDVSSVDAFIELLRNKLSNDKTLKDLLLSSTETSTSDPSFTDKTVVGIVNQLYSKPESTTMSKTTHDENINSTLLADLIEAVIFRQSGTFSTEDTSLFTQVPPNVSPVKIQAELGEVKANIEFTGHYFFPEEEERTEEETTETYNDLENLSVSDISLEIEFLKRNSETKDFLEDILESDFITESILKDLPILTTKNETIINYNKQNELSKREQPTESQVKRLKRRIYLSSIDNHGMIINYRNLLKKLVFDLRNLKLNEKFRCSIASSTKDVPHKTCFLYIMYCYCLLYCMNNKRM